MHTRGVTATPLRIMTTSPPRVCIIFLIIQRPVVNYSLLNARLAIVYPAYSMAICQVIDKLKWVLLFAVQYLGMGKNYSYFR